MWIDALEFSDLGGWKPDTQFTHLMGSGFLLACGEPGVPVEDARTDFSIVAGRYRVWVRARNWYYSAAPGKFTLAIDGSRSSVVLGELPSNDWVWQIAGDYSLDAGLHTLALIDLTGYFGRCSSILITDDLDYVPPRPVEDFERERARFKGLSLEPEDGGSYDVIVVGGGPGGVPAALAAARHGAKTLLLTNRPVLGGNASTEAGVGFNGASARQPNAREGGINEEIIRTKGYDKGTWTAALERLCSEESNLTVLYNLHLCGAEVEAGRIRRVTARHTVAGTRHRFSGAMFIDSTGDSWLAYYAGAKYRLGREARWQYDEEFAPEVADLLTMSGCLMNVRFEDTGVPVPFNPPAWVPVFPAGKKFGRNIEHIGMAWWNEAPNVLDDVYDAELARDELFRVMLGYFHYLKNLWDDKERAANYRFVSMSHIDAKRESRRIIGDYTLTQNDCMAGVDFDDTVSHAGWPIDLHHPKGIYSGEEGPFFSNTHVPLVKIPYRCLYSCNVGNLFAAGRNVSVTHIALGTARLQGTIAAMGQAAGTAAALCVHKGVAPRELGRNHLAEFRQTLLKDDQYIPGLRNDDPLDLARTGTVLASSVSLVEPYVNRIGIDGSVLPLDRQRATFFARGVSEELPELYLRLTNTTSEEIPLTLHVREQADPDGYVSEHDLAVVTRMVPANSETWVHFPLGLRTRLRYLWAYVHPTPGLGWRIWTSPPLDWTRSERFSAADRFENMRGQTHCLSMEKPEEVSADCGPQNVINGYSRAQSAREYCWVSDVGQGLPQWLELTLPQAAKVGEIHVTFDPDMTNSAMLHPIATVPLRLVTAYEIAVYDGQTWQTVVRREGNYLRKQVHRFEPVETRRIRLTVLDSGDHTTARVFEIRAYSPL